MAKDHNDENCICTYEEEFDCACDSKMGLALKIGIGVAAVAVIGSVVTLAILKKRKND